MYVDSVLMNEKKSDSERQRERERERGITEDKGAACLLYPLLSVPASSFFVTCSSLHSSCCSLLLVPFPFLELLPKCNNE